MPHYSSELTPINTVHFQWLPMRRGASPQKIPRGAIIKMTAAPDSGWASTGPKMRPRASTGVPIMQGVHGVGGSRGRGTMATSKFTFFERSSPVTMYRGTRWGGLRMHRLVTILASSLSFLLQLVLFWLPRWGPFSSGMVLVVFLSLFLQLECVKLFYLFDKGVMLYCSQLSRL